MQSRKPASRQTTPPAPGAAPEVLRSLKSSWISRRARVSPWRISSRASWMMPSTREDIDGASACSWSGMVSPPRRTRHQEARAEADQQRLERVTADHPGQVLHHVADAVLLEVAAAGFEGVGDAGGHR